MAHPPGGVRVKQIRKGGVRRSGRAKPRGGRVGRVVGGGAVERGGSDGDVGVQEEGLVLLRQCRAGPPLRVHQRLRRPPTVNQGI
eukprot:924326-Prorocentrum_minimum.AAC.2